MSWQDDLKYNRFEIITGDGKQWFPSLLPTYQDSVEFNGVSYEFIDKAGTLFARRLPKGRQFPLEFAFTGGDNITAAESFKLSAGDIRAWRIIHPLYGIILVQPISLSSDSSALDSTIIKMTVIETMSSNKPTEVTNYVDLLENNRTYVKEQILRTSFPINANLPVKNLQLATSVSNTLTTDAKKLTKLETEYAALQKYSKNALNEINNATGITQQYLAYIQGVIEVPANVTASIGSRFSSIENSLMKLGTSLVGMATIGYFEKLMYNLFGVAMVTSLCKSVTVVNSGDFRTRKEVLNYTQALTRNYEAFLYRTYSLEDSVKPAKDLMFTPDHNLMLATHSMVCDTLAYMYQAIFNANQEFTYVTPRDTNIILLAHRLLGIASEENIDSIKTVNNIGLSEIINIKKGREIKYYL